MDQHFTITDVNTITAEDTKEDIIQVTASIQPPDGVASKVTLNFPGSLIGKAICEILKRVCGKI